MYRKKVEIAVILTLVGWLVSASLRAGQIENKVETHESSLKSYDEKIDHLNNKIDKIDGTVSYIRGILDSKKEGH